MPKKLTARWSRRERDILIDFPVVYDGHYLASVFGKDFIGEMESRGYNIHTLRFSIERKPERDLWVVSKNGKYWTGRSWHKDLRRAVPFDEDDARKTANLKKACVLNFFEEQKEGREQ